MAKLEDFEPIAKEDLPITKELPPIDGTKLPHIAKEQPSVVKKDLPPIAKKDLQVKPLSQSPQGGYAALYKAMNPFTPPTAEELAKAKKKQDRDQIFNAIGDGVSAISNLVFTSIGAPNMYDGKRTLTGQSKIRYDKMMADKKADTKTYLDGYLRAKQADDALAASERSWQRLIGIDDYNKTKDAAEVKAKAAAAATQNEHWQAAHDLDVRQLEETKSYHNATLAANKAKEANLEKHRGSSSSSKKDKVGFKDAAGNQIAIDEDVLDGSMAEIYDNIVNDPKAKGLPMYEKPRTDADIENYVKKYWSSSPSATKFMLELSQYSTTDESKLNESSEEVKPYQFGSLDYNQGKNRPVWDPTK